MNAHISPIDIPHIVRLRNEMGLSWPAIAQRYGRPASDGPTFAHAVARILRRKASTGARQKRLCELDNQASPTTGLSPTATAEAAPERPLRVRGAERPCSPQQKRTPIPQ